MSILDSINFESLSVFTPYFNKYKEWKNGALYTLDYMYEDKKDSVMFSLDISNYFYSVDFSFKNLYKDLSSNDDSRIFDFQVLSKYIEKIYKRFTKIVAEIRTDVKKEKLILPIGLLSAAILGNYCLLDFDKKIIQDISPQYYARYVDDILIIFEESEDGKTANVVSDYISAYLDSAFIQKADRYCFANYTNLFIQNKKIKILKHDHTQSKAALKVLINEIAKVSEPKLIPNISLNIQNFMDSLYTNDIRNAKLRDINALSLDKLNLINSITSYLRLNKNTNKKRKSDSIFKLPERKAIKKIKTQYDELDYNTGRQMNLLLASNTIFELYARWEKIFYFILLTREDPLVARNFFNALQLKIENIEITEIENIADKCVEQMKKQIVCDLKEVAEIAYACSIAIRFELKSKSTKLQGLASRIRLANMFDHKMVSCPLINFVDIKHEAYHLANFASYTEKYFHKQLDDTRIMLSPRFIHLHEYMLYKNLFFVDEIHESEFLTKCIEEYNAIVKLIGGAKDNSLLYSNQNSDKTTRSNSKYSIINIKVNSNKHMGLAPMDDIHIAMANIDMSKKELFDKNNKINFCEVSIEDKYELLALLSETAEYKEYVPASLRRIKRRGNLCIKYIPSHMKNQIKFIVFPELCIPYEWIGDIAEFCKQTKIAVITGIRYFKIGERIYNLVATILPVSSEKGYKSAIVDIREKNDYSPLEKRMLEQEKYKYNEDQRSVYKIYNYDGIDFSVFNCYELTDIYARANMKSKLDLLFAPELNEDISYFSNIIESTSRDIYCYVAQVNSSSYGDTRILGPLNDKMKNIATIKGGEKSRLHVGQVNIEEFREYQRFEKGKKYNDYLDKQLEAKRNKKNDPNRKYKKTSAKHIPK